jgi:hypothetical protein
VDDPVFPGGVVKEGERLLEEPATSPQLPDALDADPVRRTAPVLSVATPEPLTALPSPHMRPFRKFPDGSKLKSMAALVPPRKLCVEPLTIKFPL